MRKNLDNGFTLVELLLAMAFFSFILLFVTTGFIMINRSYTKGINVKLVQDEGREVIEQLSREFRTASTSGVDLSYVASNNCLGIGSYRYYWSAPIDSSDPTNSPKLLMREEGLDCSDPIDNSNPTGTSMLNERVGVQSITAANLGAGTGGIYEIKVVLSTSDTDLIINPGESAECSTGSGNQYCDVVDFTTVVSTR